MPELAVNVSTTTPAMESLMSLPIEPMMGITGVRLSQRPRHSEPGWCAIPLV